jgi:hypothetical protein
MVPDRSNCGSRTVVDFLLMTGLQSQIRECLQGRLHGTGKRGQISSWNFSFIENFISLRGVSYVVLCITCKGTICLGRVVDILEASGAFDPGSNPGRGVTSFYI